MKFDEKFRINKHGIYQIFNPLDVKSVTRPQLSTIAGVVREVCNVENYLKDKESNNIVLIKELRRFIEDRLSDFSDTINTDDFWNWFQETYDIKTITPGGKKGKDQKIEAFYPYSPKAVLASDYGTKGRHGDYGAGKFIFSILKRDKDLFQNVNDLFSLNQGIYKSLFDEFFFTENKRHIEGDTVPEVLCTSFIDNVILRDLRKLTSIKYLDEYHNVIVSYIADLLNFYISIFFLRKILGVITNLTRDEKHNIDSNLTDLFDCSGLCNNNIESLCCTPMILLDCIPKKGSPIRKNSSFTYGFNINLSKILFSKIFKPKVKLIIDKYKITEKMENRHIIDILFEDYFEFTSGESERESRKILDRELSAFRELFDNIDEILLETILSYFVSIRSAEIRNFGGSYSKYSGSSNNTEGYLTSESTVLQRRYKMSDSLLEALIFVTCLDEEGDIQFHRLSDVLRFWERDYGLYIDYNPEDELTKQLNLADETSYRKRILKKIYESENINIYKENLLSFKNKLREKGLLKEYSDAEDSAYLVSPLMTWSDSNE